MESYILDIGHKFEISIKQLETPPQNLNIWELEKHGVLKTMNYLFNMPDPDKKMTLCAYPQKVRVKPDKFDAVKGGKFWMVNGQHCMAVSKQMQGMDNIPNDKKEKFKTWECFVVWNKDDSII